MGRFLGVLTGLGFAAGMIFAFIDIYNKPGLAYIVAGYWLLAWAFIGLLVAYASVKAP